MRKLAFLLSGLIIITSAKSQITNLIFEGAGIRGIAYCGAISEMESNGMMKQVKRVGGTSAGAITALAISIGYTGEELEEITGSMNYKKFNDGNFAFAGGINRVSKYFGWYRSLEFDKWLGKFIGKKTGNADITFEELHAQNNKFKELYVTGTSLNRQKTVIFSHEHFPKMKIRDAVRISMSVPLYFEAVFMDEEGKTYNHPKDKKNLQVMVDGGFIANYPLWLFDSSRYRNDFNGTNIYTANNETLGFRIDREEQIELDQQGINELAPMPIENIKQYMQAFMLLMMESMNRPQQQPNDHLRSIAISDGKLGPRIRKMKKEEIKLLNTNGHKAVISFLKTRS